MHGLCDAPPSPAGKLAFISCLFMVYPTGTVQARQALETNANGMALPSVVMGYLPTLLPLVNGVGCRC